MIGTVRKVLVRGLVAGVLVYALLVLTLRGHIIAGAEDLKFRWGFDHVSCSRDLLLRGLPGALKVSGNSFRGDGTKLPRAPQPADVRRRAKEMNWTVYELKNRRTVILEQNGTFWQYGRTACGGKIEDDRRDRRRRAPTTTRRG